MDDKVKAIEILQDEIAEKQRQIKLIMDLDLSGQVTEEIWHHLCRTPLRTSRSLNISIFRILPHMIELILSIPLSQVI